MPVSSRSAYSGVTRVTAVGDANLTVYGLFHFRYDISLAGTVTSQSVRAHDD